MPLLSRNVLSNSPRGPVLAPRVYKVNLIHYIRIFTLSACPNQLCLFRAAPYTIMAVAHAAVPSQRHGVGTVAFSGRRNKKTGAADMRGSLTAS